MIVPKSIGGVEYRVGQSLVKRQSLLTRLAVLVFSLAVVVPSMTVLGPMWLLLCVPPALSIVRANTPVPA